MDTAIPFTRSTVCFHCGESGGAEAMAARVNGAEQDFCCRGCAGAAEWIATAGLSDYYRLRQSEAARVDASDDDLSLWDRPEVQAEHVRHLPEGAQITVLTDGMRCAACAWLIDRALRRRPVPLPTRAPCFPATGVACTRRPLGERCVD